MTARRPTLVGALIVASCLVNVVLAYAVWPHVGATTAFRSTRAASPAPTVESDATVNPSAAFPAARPVARTAVSSWWAAIDRPDPAEVINQLRAAGVPERLVRGIIWERLHEDRNEAWGPPEDLPYWQRFSRRLTAAAQKRRDEAGDAMLKEFQRLLGGVPFDVPNLGWFEVESALKGLSADSNLRLLELTEQIARRQRNAELALGPGADPEAYRLLFAQTARDTEAARHSTLSPAEYDTYMLRHAPEMISLQSRSAGLDLSESEYRALLDIVRSSDDQLQVGILGAVRDPALRTQVIAALGADRLADLDQALNGSQKTNRLLDRLELPLHLAPTLDAVRDDIRARATAVRQDASLAATAQQQQLAALAAEARQRLTATLSPSGYDAYYEYRGEWLDEIAPPSSLPADPTTAAIPGP